MDEDDGCVLVGDGGALLPEDQGINSGGLPLFSGFFSSTILEQSSGTESSSPQLKNLFSLYCLFFSPDGVFF